MEWNGTAYQLAAKGNKTGTSHLVAAGGSIYAVANDRRTIDRFDPAMRLTGSLVTTQVDTLTTDGSNLFVTSAWNLTAYNLDLQELDRLRLDPPKPTAKALHALAIVDGHAYVLDSSQLRPYAIFKVDISQPADLRLGLATQVNGTDPPMLQWVRPSADRWLVQSSYTWNGGGEHRLTVLQASDGKVVGDLEIYSSASPHPGQSGAPFLRGYVVHSQTHELPGLAIISNRTSYLAKVDADDEHLHFSCPHQLPGITGLWGAIATDGQWAVVAARNTLLTFDVSGGLHLVASQPVDSSMYNLQVLL